jgi:hypothetical protein
LERDNYSITPKTNHNYRAPSQGPNKARKREPMNPQFTLQPWMPSETSPKQEKGALWVRCECAKKPIYGTGMQELPEPEG